MKPDHVGKEGLTWLDQVVMVMDSASVESDELYSLQEVVDNRMKFTAMFWD